MPSAQVEAVVQESVAGDPPLVCDRLISALEGELSAAAGSRQAGMLSDVQGAEMFSDV